MHTEQPLSVANRVTAWQKATEVFAKAYIYTSSTDLTFIAYCLGDITAFETYCPFTDDNYGIKERAQNILGNLWCRPTSRTYFWIQVCKLESVVFLLATRNEIFQNTDCQIYQVSKQGSIIAQEANDCRQCTAVPRFLYDPRYVELLVTAKDKTNTCADLDKSWRLTLPEFLDNPHIRVERLSALRTGRLYPEKTSYSCQRLSTSQDHSATGIFNYTW